jgi:hypothetical protein
MSSDSGESVSVRSRLQHLSPDDHAKMILSPMLAAVGIASLMVGVPVVDGFFISSLSFIFAGVTGYQGYMAWQAAPRSAATPNATTVQ